MSRIFLGNFDFEHQLASPGYNRPARLAALNSELSAHLLPLTRPGDHVQFADDLPAGFLAGAVDAGIVDSADVAQAAPAAGSSIEPWGWSQPVLDTARSQGLLTEAPPIAAVRLVNSRMFSNQLETRLGIGLPGARTITAYNDLLDAISESASRSDIAFDQFSWVVKGEFSMACRERLLGRGEPTDPPSINWVTSRLARRQTLYFEPWLKSEIEVSTHWDIPPGDDEPTFIGTTTVFGGNTGNAALPSAAFPEMPHECREVILSTSRTVAYRVQAAGYFGPLGVDAMVYLDQAGQVRVRPIQDINGRWSMGRVALRLAERLAPDRYVEWSHVPAQEVCRHIGLQNTAEQEQFHQHRPLEITDAIDQSEWPIETVTGSRFVLTSPLWLAGRLPNRTSVLCICPLECRNSSNSAATS